MKFSLQLFSCFLKLLLLRLCNYFCLFTYHHFFLHFFKTLEHFVFFLFRFLLCFLSIPQLLNQSFFFFLSQRSIFFNCLPLLLRLILQFHSFLIKTLFKLSHSFFVFNINSFFTLFNVAQDTVLSHNFFRINT